MTFRANPGETGDHVSRLQTLLVSIDPTVVIDGQYGGKTLSLVKNAKAKAGMPTNDGIVGDSLILFLQSTIPRNSVREVAEALSMMSTKTSDSAIWSSSIHGVMSRHRIQGPKSKASFLANLLTETGCFSRKPLSENLNYSTNALLTKWPNRFSVENARKYGRNEQHGSDPKMIAILVYGGRMGNAPFPSTDGWDYRGRGPIQLTGKDNYTAYSKFSGKDVVKNPDIVLDAEVGSDTAGWFWSSKKCSAAAESGDYEKVRLLINGGKNGLQETILATEEILGFLSRKTAP